MYQSAIWETEQRLGGALPSRSRIAVKSVLIDSVVDGLREIALQFASRDRNAIEKHDQVNRIFVMQRITDLTDNPQPIIRIFGQNVWVHCQGGPKLCQREGLAQSQQFDAVPKNV